MADPVRLPNRDVVQIVSQLTDAGLIEKYLFNDIGGTELINIVRNDSVTGVRKNYTLIADLQTTEISNCPCELLLNKAKVDSDFDQYSILLASRIPSENYYYNNQEFPEYNLGTNSYYDNGSLVIEFDNMNDDTEFVQIQVLTDGRIYTVREHDY